MSGEVGGTGVGRAGVGWQRAWSEALDELELHADLAERLLAHHHLPRPERDRLAAWHPPAGLGPLPAPLLERARALLARQSELARRAADAALLSRRHLAAVDGMIARPEADPVFVDVAG